MKIWARGEFKRADRSKRCPLLTHLAPRKSLERKPFLGYSRFSSTRKLFRPLTPQAFLREIWQEWLPNKFEPFWVGRHLNFGFF
jgi:hypothetical protein